MLSASGCEVRTEWCLLDSIDGFDVGGQSGDEPWAHDNTAMTLLIELSNKSNQVKSLEYGPDGDPPSLTDHVDVI